MQKRGYAWGRILLAGKVVVFILACRYLIGYALRFNVAGIVGESSMAYLAAALASSLLAFILQTHFLKRVSAGRLSFIDSFFIEFYTLLINLGVASSFFSLPKIALINRKVKDVGDSIMFFFTPMVLGVMLRLVVVASAWVAVYVSALAGVGVFAALLTTMVIIIKNKEKIKIIDRIKVSSGMMGELFAIGLASVILTSLSYYFILCSITQESPQLTRTILTEGVGYLSGFFSPLPSGLGVREFALTQLHVVTGVPKDIAFTTAILHRFTLVGGQLILGLIFSAFYMRPDS